MSISTVTFRMPAQRKRILDDYARQKGMTVTDVLRALIEPHLDALAQPAEAPAEPEPAEADGRDGPTAPNPYSHLPTFHEPNAGPRCGGFGGDPRDPSPRQIAERAAIIRQGWDDREHYVRAGHRVPVEHAEAADDSAGRVDAVEAPQWSGPAFGDVG